MPFYMPLGDIKGAPLAGPVGLAAGSGSDAAGPAGGTGGTILIRNHELFAEGGAAVRDDAGAARVELPDVQVTSYQLTGHGDAAAGGTGKTLPASLLGQAAPEDQALDHGTTVLAWARVDGAAAAGPTIRDKGDTITDFQFSGGAIGDAAGEGFSWASTTPAGDGGPRVAVFDGRSGTGDDVIVDGGIITGENPAAMADVEWKYVTVRPPAAQDDVPAALVGPFEDLSDMTAGVVASGGPYSTGYVKVSGDGF